MSDDIEWASDPVLFPDLMYPNGALTDVRETHALFYYYLLAHKNYEEQHKGRRLVYEGEDDPRFNYQQLHKSVAKMYAVEPEAMAHAWPEVDKTCILFNLPLLPDEERFRPFTRPIIIP